MESRGSDSCTEVTVPTHFTGKQPSWHHLYFFLAVLNIVTITAGLHVQHGISRVYSDMVAIGRQWEQRSGRYARLGQLANALSAPGNDVLTSHDSHKESAPVRQGV